MKKDISSVAESAASPNVGPEAPRSAGGRGTPGYGKPSPGPWRLEANANQYAIMAASQWIVGLHQSWPHAKANARLIAAAPDLLAALKSLDTLLDFGAEPEGGEPMCAPENPSLIIQRFREARAAIALAEEG